MAASGVAIGGLALNVCPPPVGIDHHGKAILLATTACVDCEGVPSTVSGITDAQAIAAPDVLVLTTNFHPAAS